MNFIVCLRIIFYSEMIRNGLLMEIKTLKKGGGVAIFIKKRNTLNCSNMDFNRLN